MKITKNTSYVKFNFENGYILKAEGEMLINRHFVVYKDSIDYWEPHMKMRQLQKMKLSYL